MKMTKTIMLGGAMLCATSACALVWSLDQVRVRPAIPVSQPISNDTVNTKGQKFDLPTIFNQRVNLDFSTGTYTDKSMNAADSIFTFDAPASGRVLYLTETLIRPSGYTAGNIKVECNAPYEVLVNKASKVQKTTAEDSICEASMRMVPVTMQPEDTYQVCVKIIADAGAKAPEMKLNFIPDEKSEANTIVSGPAIKERFLLPATDQGVRATSSQISPDGKYLLTFFTDKQTADITNRYIQVSEVKSGRILTTLERAAWMPKGSTLYFTRKSADGFDVYTMTLPDMQQKLLYSGIPTDNFTWSPNEQYIIYYDTEEAAADTTPLHRYLTPDDRIAGNRNRYFLKKYDLASGAEQTITYGTKNTVLADISADGNKLLFTTSAETPSKYPFYSFNLIQLDMNTMKADTLIRDNGYLTTAVYSPDAKRLFVIGSARVFGDLGVKIGDEPIPNDYDLQGFIYDIATQKATAVTRDFDPSIANPVWNRVDGNVYFKAYDGFFVKVAQLNPNTNKITTLPTEVANVGSFSVGNEESQWLSYTGQGPDYAGREYLMNLKTGKSTLLADPLKPTFDNIELAETQPWTYTYKDGTVIDGTLTLPPNFDPNKKYPLIVYYYGGTLPSTYSVSHAYAPQIFASRDYVVYVLNPSGTYGYGQEFSARHVNAWGKRTADEIIEGVKKVVADHPFIDGSKIGCLGASYGGFMTQYLQTLTDIFTAAVSHAGISNVTSYWGEGYWGYSYNSVAAAESYPWTNPELFTKQGSLFNADKIHTPLLLLHGTADTNVPIGESIQIFNALKILNREVEFITIDGEDHISGYYPYNKLLLWQNTIMAWFDKWLKDDPRWWNEMYPTPNL
jgi:dipeptidyl aminopeptidase/acylaminoacyl peptidase